MNLTPEESRRRAENFARIKHSTEMEGGSVPPEAEAIIVRFVDGHIDEAEMMRQIGAVFGGGDGTR